jgi:hypothetical protein
MHPQAQPYNVESFKAKMKDESRRIAILNTVYIPTIFVAISSLYISFAFLAWDFIWYTDYSDPLELIFEDLFYGLGITMSVLSIPLIVGLVLRIVFMINLSSAISELGRTYTYLYHKTRKVSSFLRTGVIVEIALVFVIPIVGNFGGAIVVLYAYYHLHEILEDLKSKGLYDGDVKKSLFYSYLMMVVIFPAVAIPSLVVMSATWYTGIHNYILAILPIIIFLAGTIWHCVAFFDFSKSLENIQDPTPEAVAAARTYVPQTYVPYAPQPQYVYPPQQAQYTQQPQQLTGNQGELGSFCITCGAKLEASAKFCPTCGTAK